MNTKNLPGGKGLPERKANNLTATCPYPEPDQSSQYHLRLGLYHSGFPTKILYAFLFGIKRASCRAHLILLDMIILIILGKEYKRSVEKIYGRDPQSAWRQDELIDGKPLVVK
jgi:hypothetical protein